MFYKVVYFKLYLDGSKGWFEDYIVADNRADALAQTNPEEMLTAPLIRKAVYGEWDCNGWTNGGEHKCK